MLQDAAVDEIPSLDFLLENVQNLQRERWDWALPDGLLRKAYASHYLDLPEGLKWVKAGLRRQRLKWLHIVLTLKERMKRQKICIRIRCGHPSVNGFLCEEHKREQDDAVTLDKDAVDVLFNLTVDGGKISQEDAKKEILRIRSHFLRACDAINSNTGSLEVRRTSQCVYGLCLRIAREVVLLERLYRTGKPVYRYGLELAVTEAWAVFDDLAKGG